MVPSPKEAFIMDLMRYLKPVVLIVVIAAAAFFFVKKRKKHK